MANFIDRWVDRLGGSNWDKVPREECLRRIAAGLQVTFQEGQEGKLLFAGTAAPQEIERVAKDVEALLPDRRITCLSGKNVTQDAQTVLAAKDCFGIVLVEEKERSIYPAIEQEIAAFKDMGKEVLGFVLIQG